MCGTFGKRWVKVVALLGAVAALGFLVSRLIKSMGKDQPGTPPGSLGLPVLGETLSYAKNPHRFFNTRVGRYGPVFKTRLLGRPVVCFTGPEAFTFFVNQPSFDRQGANPGHIQKLLCERSLPLIDGSAHRQMRSAVLQAFKPEALETYLTIIEQNTLPYLERWERTGSFTWVPEYKRLSASICSSLLLGHRPGMETDGLVRVLDSFMAGLTALPINLPWTMYRRALKSRDVLLDYIDDAIERHKEQPYEDMLAELLRASSDDGSSLSDQQVRAQMVHMFFAAYGGIFRVLTLMSMSLAQNPDVMEGARREVVESAASGPIDLERLSRLTYLDQVTREVRRHNPIFASTFFDWVTEPVDYSGYHVPEGWKATGGIYTTMQDSSVFTRPGIFDPDRFAPGREEDKRAENSYIPQGGGSMEGHRCPAEDLTTVLMKAVATLLLRSYTWELLPQDLRLNDEPSPLPRDGLKVRFERLEAAR